MFLKATYFFVGKHSIFYDFVIQMYAWTGHQDLSCGFNSQLLYLRRCFLYMVEAKVIGTHVTKFFCVDKLVLSKERGKVQKLSLNFYQNESHTYTNLRLSGLLLGLIIKSCWHGYLDSVSPGIPVAHRIG